MERVLQYFALRYYIVVIDMILCAVALITSIIYYKRNPLLKYFLLYFGFLLIIDFVFIIFVAYDLKNDNQKMVFYLEFIFVNIEFLIFSNLIYHSVKYIIFKKIIKAIIITFLLYSLYTILFENIIRKKMEEVYLIEDLFLLIPAILYFIDIFKSIPNLKLINEASFWVITGILFFMACTLPLTIIQSYLRENSINAYRNMYAVYDVFNCLLFLMIIRAFLCNPVKTK